MHATKANQLIFFSYTLDAKICARALEQQKKTDLAFCQNVKKKRSQYNNEGNEKKTQTLHHSIIAYGKLHVSFV